MNFKAGDLVVATDDPKYSALAKEGFILGEVLHVHKTGPCVTVSVLCSKRNFYGGLPWPVGSTANLLIEYFKKLT